MVTLQSKELKNLLRNQQLPKQQEHCNSNNIVDSSLKPTCDVGFVLFLEPTEKDDPNWTNMEYIADRVIRTFSPRPTMSHVELVVPPIPDSGGGRVHFATYLGAEGADWQNRLDRRSEGIDFYLISNGSRWRCIPVFAPNVAESLRNACDSNIHSPYSLSMYPTSARPLRHFAWIWSDTPKHMGHCATITSRVLKQAGAGYALSRPSPWYCPSSLYSELKNSLPKRLDERERASLDTTDLESCLEAIELLVRGQLSVEVVRNLGDSRCIDAIRVLTMRVVETSTTENHRIAQKELASAVLRWVLLRSDT